MRLEKKEQEELAERKGLAIKTIVQIIWLVISFGIAYYLLNALESEGIFSYGQIYRTLSLPTTVPKWAVQGGVMLIFVIIMQFILFLAFAWASPEGRRRPGRASLHSRHKDPFDRGY